MDHTMVFGYSYCRWPKMTTVSICSFDIGHLMAMAVRWCDTKCIIQCSMSRATPEATGRRHRVTTRSILPQRPPGQQAKKQQSTNTPKKVAMLTAAVVRRYNTAGIAQWRRSRALLEATGPHHRVSIMSDNINQTWLRRFFLMFPSSKP